MKQENGVYIADEGKAFQRVYDGFKKLDTPQGYFFNLILGNILIDSNGNKLVIPIPDKIQYYEEVELPITNTENI